MSRDFRDAGTTICRRPKNVNKNGAARLLKTTEQMLYYSQRKLMLHEEEAMKHTGIAMSHGKPAVVPWNEGMSGIDW